MNIRGEPLDRWILSVRTQSGLLYQSGYGTEFDQFWHHYPILGIEKWMSDLQRIKALQDFFYPEKINWVMARKSDLAHEAFRV